MTNLVKVKVSLPMRGPIRLWLEEHNVDTTVRYASKDNRHNAVVTTFYIEMPEQIALLYELKWAQ